MLVLSRRVNEQIVIDDRITVTVIEVRGDKVRLGIDAPLDVHVHRQEIWARIHGADAVAVLLEANKTGVAGNAVHEAKRRGQEAGRSVEHG